ncbi:SDR family NAD(P)-dependent oxidoreductase [Luteimonas salinilitoris]|uniref:SDR family NAD(P)-dependent oxidoreductase n=1 Tax=Luteimonas salinilitoris TaxID=3237697 RepID=A0ABV4HVL1_9GAMM
MMSPDPAVLITGATGGLGRRTALELARRGRSVVVGGRRRDAVEGLCSEIAQLGVEATPFVADLASLGDVRRALDDLGDLPLHGVVANAGINTTRDQRSVDGYELTFAVNVLSHQLLLCRLAGQLVDQARVVIVASGVHLPENKLARRCGIPAPRWVGARSLAMPDEAPAERRLDNGRQRYSTSKLANVLQARGLQQRLRQLEKTADVFAIDPGLMVDTDLARELPAALRGVLRAVGRLATPFVDNMRLSPIAAGHVAALVEEPGWRGKGFGYLDGDLVVPPSKDAQRDELMEELWHDSVALTGLQQEETCLPLGESARPSDFRLASSS